MTGLPWAPRLVVTMMTPFAPRTPYTAVEAASFRTLMPWISFGSIALNSANACSEACSTPSMMMSGVDVP